MTGLGSKRKGSAAEIEVARLLQDWWRRLEPGCEFVRTPGSGGWGKPSVRSGFRASGDLMTTAQQFPFVVEVKRREQWNLERFHAGKPSPVHEWFRQAERQASEMLAIPMLWIRHSREPWRVVLPIAVPISARIRSDAALSHCVHTFPIVTDQGPVYVRSYLASDLLKLQPKLVLR